MEVFNDIKKRLEKVSDFMKLSKEELDVLLKHEKVNYSIINVSGKNYDAWRIIHNNALGPGKGGIRFHSDASEDEVKSLSFWMSLKTSLMGLPFGGAKGGVRVNPKELSEDELEELSREYIRTFHKDLGVNKDIPAPDVYTNSQIMGWMLDEYEKIKGYSEPGMITGKFVELGGLKLRKDSTSAGGMIILKEFLKRIYEKLGYGSQIRESSPAKESKRSHDILSDTNEWVEEKSSLGEDSNLNKFEVTNKNIKIAIQGFGNVGMNIASMLVKEGFKIIAVSDSKGGVYEKEGLNIDEVINVKKQGSVQDYSSKKISNSKLLELDVDVLILAALENQITLNNVENIKADSILELANGPISSEADKKLNERGVVVIPDILANAGGVVVSYFEWANNKSGNILEEDFLKNKFQEIMKKSFKRVWDFYEENKNRISMKEASYVIALRRILDAEGLRGRLKNI